MNIEYQMLKKKKKTLEETGKYLIVGKFYSFVNQIKRTSDIYSKEFIILMYKNCISCNPKYKKGQFIKRELPLNARLLRSVIHLQFLLEHLM